MTLRTPYVLKGNISKEIIDICKQPIMLRFFAEAYSKEKVPKMDIRRIQIFNKYWDKKLSEKKMEREGRDFLFNLVEIMIQLRKVELGEKILIRNTHINPDSPDTIFSKILSENIIIFKDYDKIMHENKIGFTYEAFFEFVIARRFLSDYTEICEKELLEKFKGMIDDIPSFKNYMGAIEYIILLLEENEEKIYIKLTNMISEIREYNDIAIRIISKLRSPLSVQTALKMLANDYELDINNQVYNIFINNYKYFSNSYNKDMFYIFSSETNPKFRRKPIKFLLDNYNALPDELKQLIIHLSENKNEITRIELAKAITNYAPSEDTSQAGLPSDIFGKLLSNLFINADRLLLAEVMDLLSETYASLEKNTRDLILLEMMKNSLIEYSQLDKIIINNINIISTKAIREILIRFIVDQDPLIRLKAIFYLKRIIDNINYKYDGILSREEIYEFAKILKRDNDIEINRIAGEQFSRIN